MDLHKSLIVLFGLLSNLENVQGCSQIGPPNRGSFLTGISTTTNSSVLAARFKTFGLYNFQTEVTIDLEALVIGDDGDEGFRMYCGYPREAPLVGIPDTLADPMQGYRLTVAFGNSAIATLEDTMNTMSTNTTDVNVTFELTNYEKSRDYADVSYFVSPRFGRAYVLYTLPNYETGTVIIDLADNRASPVYGKFSGGSEVAHSLDNPPEVYDDLNIARYKTHGASCTAASYLHYTDANIRLQSEESIFAPERRALLQAISVDKINYYSMVQPQGSVEIPIFQSDPDYEGFFGSEIEPKQMCKQSASGKVQCETWKDHPYVVPRQPYIEKHDFATGAVVGRYDISKASYWMFANSTICTDKLAEAARTSLPTKSPSRPPTAFPTNSPSLQATGSPSLPSSSEPTAYVTIGTLLSAIAMFIL